MPEQFLNGSDVIAALQQMRCEAVLQRVGGGLLGNTGLSRRDIAGPDPVGGRELRTKLGVQGLRQHHDAVLASLASG